MNLNLHLHTHAIDGVFTEQDDGTLAFHALRPPTQRELYVLVSTVRDQVLEYAAEQGLLHGDPPPDGDNALLSTLAAASAQYLRALGPTPGAAMQRLLGIDPQVRRRPKSRLAVRHDGFDLHAGLAVRARRRKVLERCAPNWMTYVQPNGVTICTPPPANGGCPPGYVITIQNGQQFCTPVVVVL